VSKTAVLKALRDGDLRVAAERDRRYTEVSIEREKALQIKTEADHAALLLAKTQQDYRDEKANELRSQIESERGGYATKHDLEVATEKVLAVIKPALDFVTSEQGRDRDRQRLTGNTTTYLLVIAAFAAVAGHYVH
jgi:hypothetical protein